MLEFSSWRDDDCVMKVEGLRRKSEKKNLGVNIERIHLIRRREKILA